jgi:hypothetical protein
MHYKNTGRWAGAAVAALILLFGAPHAAGAQQAGVTVTINGSAVDFSPPPIIQAGRVFVPLRGVFERLGASVVYSQGTINATGNGRDISLQIGSTQATVNGQTQTIDVAPFIVGASTFVPLRFVSEALGATVDWDDANSVASIELAGAGGSSGQQNDNTQTYLAPTSDYVTQQAPPPLPVYQQPYVPYPNWIWQPGYWAWGAYGYYWVPGTWVAPPQVGYLWTPGYWTFGSGGFAFVAGYWATQVGFYGGVNYGAGYYGNGYVGGRWYGNAFRYNTAVTTVNRTYITNVYVDKTVIVNNYNYTNVNRTSYNGGPHGLPYRPTPQQLAVRQITHLPPTVVQKQHVQVAAQDRQLLATVNHNHPPAAVVVVARPLTTTARPAGFVPVTPADRAPAQPHVVAPVYHAAPVQVHTAEPYHAPATPYHAPAPVYHAPPVQVHTAEPYRAPATPYHAPAPVYHAPPAQVHTAEPYRAPAPVYHAPATPYHAPATPYHAPPPVYHAPPAQVHTAVPYHAPVHTAAPYHAPPPAHPAQVQQHPPAEPHEVHTAEPQPK